MAAARPDLMPVFDDPRELEKLPLFEGLSEEELSRLNELLRKRVFPAGTRVWRTITSPEARVRAIERNRRMYALGTNGGAYGTGAITVGRAMDVDAATSRSVHRPSVGNALFG